MAKTKMKTAPAKKKKPGPTKGVTKKSAPKKARVRAKPTFERAAGRSAVEITAASTGLSAALPSAISVIDQITALAAQSKIAKYKWLDDNGNRGRAPLAYIKGISVVYARVYCKLKAGDPAVVDMARGKSNDATHDVLTSYNPVFQRLGMHNDSDGADTLRHLFVLLMGLGVRESSGYHCRGRYMDQGFSHAEDAEAGLFQTAYNLRNKCPSILNPLIQHYTQYPSGFLEIFSAGITCNADDWKNWGDPSEAGYKVQQLTKTCPAFAAEYAAVGMRHSLGSWGPLKRQTPEVVPDCDTLYKGVEVIMESAPGLCAQVL